jgi:hypothetical protein
VQRLKLSSGIAARIVIVPELKPTRCSRSRKIGGRLVTAGRRLKASAKTPPSSRR